MKGLMIRMGALIILLIISSLFPWWITLIFSVITAFLIDNFFELIFIGIFYDVFFHVPGSVWYMSIIHTIIYISIILGTIILQKIVYKPTIL